MFLIIFLFISILIFPQNNPFLEKQVENTSNKIILLVTLPDSTTLKASVFENESLVISGKSQYYHFCPIVNDLEKKLVQMQEIEVSGGTQIQFEVIDVLNISKSKLKPMDSCQGGTCCVTCNDWTACACAVEFPECRKSCCCSPCCPESIK